MEIKVKNTKLKGIIDNNDFETIPVVEAKLVLLRPTDGDYMGKSPLKGFTCIPGEQNYWFKPILISEIEKIEVGDWVYSPKTGFILQVVDKDKDVYGGKTTHINTINILIEIKDASRPFKILALPEHFSKEQLNMIIEGKLKDGDKVYVECYHFDSNTVDDVIVPPIVGYFIKSPLSIYPTEEKLYTREDVKVVAEAAAKRASFWGWYTPGRFNEWFEQNVK